MEGQEMEISINVHPSAVVASDVELEEGVQIGPNCVVQSGTRIGRDTVLTANVFVGPDVKIGSGNRIFPFATVGGMPQVLGLNPDSDFGKLEIGNDNVIREQATIHPSMHKGELTKIGNGNLIMVGVHIGHDCTIADQIVFSNFSQISGHCSIETGVWFSGMVLLHQFITVGKWSYAAGLAGINHDVPPFMIVSGHYPPRVRGVNKRGLKRAGLDEAQQEKVFEAYKRLYRTGVPLLETAKEMTAEKGLDENIKAIVESILRSNEHRFGRYLEQFRD